MDGYDVEFWTLVYDLSGGQGTSLFGRIHDLSSLDPHTVIQETIDPERGSSVLNRAGYEGSRSLYNKGEGPHPISPLLSMG